MATTITRSDTGAVVETGSTIYIKMGTTVQLTAVSTYTGATFRWFSGTGNNSYYILAEGTGVTIEGPTITIIPQSVGRAPYALTCDEYSSTYVIHRFYIEIEPAESTTTVPVTGCTITPSSLSLTVGETYPLTANVTPSNATDKSVTWSTGNPTVVTVDSDGVVTARGVGNAIIYAVTTDGNYRGRCGITVTDPSGVETVTSIAVNISSPYEMTVENTLTISAFAMPSTLSNRKVSFSVSNALSSIASIREITDNSITIYAIAAGSGTILCYSQLDPNIYRVITINITAENTEEVLYVSITPSDDATIYVGDSIDITAYAYPYTLSNRAVTFNVSSSTFIKITNTDDNSCTVYGYAEGTSYLYAFSQLDRNVYARIKIVVSNKPSEEKVSQIVLSCSSYEMEVDSSSTLTSMTYPTTAANRSVSQSTSDSNIATVSSNGVVTGVHKGNVTIYAIANDGGGALAEARFIVRPACYIYDGVWKKAKACICIDTSGTYQPYFADIDPFATGETGSVSYCSLNQNNARIFFNIEGSGTTLENWTYSDAENSGIMIAPNNTGGTDECNNTTAEIKFIALTDLTNVRITGEYYTEANWDIISIMKDNITILSDSGTVTNYSSGLFNMSKGSTLVFSYAKDYSTHVQYENQTKFYINCDPITI